MKHEELIQLADYLDKVAQAIPRGLPELKDVVTFAVYDLRTYTRTHIRLRTLGQAIKFAKKVPIVATMEADRLTEWMLNTTDHLEYLQAAADNL